MRTKLSILAAAVAALATIAAAPAADQSGEFCYDLDVNVNGEQLVDEEGCEELPGAPALPELP